MARTKKQSVVEESPVETALAEEAGADVNPIITAGFTLEGIQEQHKTKSAAIRFLGAKKFKTGDIARFMNIRYQHARNVLNQKMKSKTAPVSDSAPVTE